MKIKFSLSLSYQTIPLILSGLQQAKVKLVDDSKTQVNRKSLEEKDLPVSGTAIKILDSITGVVSDSDVELKSVCPKYSGRIINVADLADLTGAAMPNILGSMDLAYQGQMNASNISEGKSQANINLFIKQQNYLHY